jgi:uncharacterized protein YcbX
VGDHREELRQLFVAGFFVMHRQAGHDGEGSPLDELFWSFAPLDRFRIGSVEFFGTTLCLRCPTTTTNQETAERGKEPLRTLATYRKRPDGVVFGRNFNHAGSGTIRISDLVER